MYNRFLPFTSPLLTENKVTKMSVLQVAVQSAAHGAAEAHPSWQATLGGLLRKSLLAETLLQAGPVVKFVLFFLILLSVVCWGIILYKWLFLKRAEKNAEKFSEMFSRATSLVEVYHAAKNLPSNPLLQVFQAGYRELSRLLASPPGAGEGGEGQEATVPVSLRPGGVENVERAMQKAKSSETTQMERYLTFLATTGSTSPFIGLFGTVWGIMTAFRAIGAAGSANLATVAPGIAEALIATAMGLFAAIPAVVAYNFLVRRVRLLTKEMESFSTDLVNLIERHLRRNP